jgi:hypothetical protein
MNASASGSTSTAPATAPKVLGQLEPLALAIDAEREWRESAHREVHRAIEVLSEAFGRFVRLWMMVHAATFKVPVTEEAADALYAKFAAKVAEYFRRGHRFLHDLPNVDDTRSTETVRKT